MVPLPLSPLSTLHHSLPIQSHHLVFTNMAEVQTSQNRMFPRLFVNLVKICKWSFLSLFFLNGSQMNPFTKDPAFQVQSTKLFSSFKPSSFDGSINPNYAVSVQQNNRFASQREINYTQMIIVPFPSLLLLCRMRMRLISHTLLSIKPNIEWISSYHAFALNLAFIPS